MTPRRRGDGSARLPLCSSDQVIAALRRLGFIEGPRRGGSHLSMYRERRDRTKDVTVVVLGKKQLPRGTLRGILKLGSVTQAEFTRALRRR